MIGENGVGRKVGRRQELKEIAVGATSFNSGVNRSFRDSVAE
jgi:hypothetical protein